MAETWRRQDKFAIQKDKPQITRITGEETIALMNADERGCLREAKEGLLIIHS